VSTQAPQLRSRNLERTPAFTRFPITLGSHLRGPLAGRAICPHPHSATVTPPHRDRSRGPSGRLRTRSDCPAFRGNVVRIVGALDDG
jgi:hypothetical protein